MTEDEALIESWPAAISWDEWHDEKTLARFPRLLEKLGMQAYIDAGADLR